MKLMRLQFVGALALAAALTACDRGTSVGSLVGTYAVEENGKLKEFIRIERSGDEYHMLVNSAGRSPDTVKVTAVDKAKLEAMLKEPVSVSFAGLGNDKIAIFRMPVGWRSGDFETKTGYWLASWLGRVDLHQVRSGPPPRKQEQVPPAPTSPSAAIVDDQTCIGTTAANPVPHPVSCVMDAPEAGVVADTPLPSPGDPARGSTAGASPSTSLPVDAETQTYFEFQVEKAAQLIESTSAIVYPSSLRSSALRGEVIAQFVVNADGGVSQGSLKILQSNHALFTQAFTDALPKMRFNAAALNGRKVRQLVQRSFTIGFERRPSTTSEPPIGTEKDGAAFVAILSSGRVEFHGESTEDGGRWPMEVRIASYDKLSGRISGEVSWPTLAAIHRLEGSLGAGILVFRETDYIRRGQAALGCEYKLTLDGPGKLIGTWGKCTGTGATGRVELARK